jgi:hypothetical protein
MPNKTIYISPENEEQWDQLENKSGTINSMLSSGTGFSTVGAVRAVTLSSASLDSTMTTKRKPGRPKKYCGHGFTKGFCRQGCI